MGITTKLALVVLLTPSVFAQRPVHPGTVSSINAGIYANSVLESRGVILYRDFQLLPVVSAFFFDDRLEVVPNALGYSDFAAGDWLRLRTRLTSVSDQPFFPNYSSIREGNPHRDETYEWTNRAELFLPGYNEQYMAEFDISYAKDLKAHRGDYVDLQAKVKIFDFRLPQLNALLEPQAFASVGWGDSRHNQYLYGPAARAELNNFSYGLWLTLPEIGDRFYPVVLVRHFEVLGESRLAEFARGRNEGWQFTLLATYGFLR